MTPVGSFSTVNLNVIFNGCPSLRKWLIEKLDGINISSFKSIKGFTFSYVHR